MFTNLAQFNELNAGDSYLQTITSLSTGVAVPYYATLQFAFRAVPAVKRITMDPDGSAVVTYFSYPVRPGASGSRTHCLNVTPDTSGQVILEYVAWRPQRAGISAVGEGDFVDIGNSLVTIYIPNAPSTTSGPVSGSVGNCPASSYSTTDSNLSVDANGLVDRKADANADP